MFEYSHFTVKWVLTIVQVIRYLHSQLSLFMKNLLLMVLIGSMIVFTSCGDDDDTTTTSGSGTFSIDGTSYNLTNAYIQDWGPNGNNSFDVDITLTLGDLDFTQESFQNLTFVYLDLNTSEQNVLQTGTYTFSVDRDVLTMVDASAGANVSADSNGNVSSGTLIDSITDGTVTVSVSSNVYTITFELTGEGDEDISGTFTGTLTQAVVN